MVKPGSKPARTYAPRRLPDADYSDPSCAYFVTICSHPDGPAAPFADERLAAAVIDSLHWLRRERGMLLYAYCLMPNHLHLLMRLAEGSGSLGTIIASMKKYTTRQSWTWGYGGQLWQDRFYDHILRKTDDAPSIIRYILQNPVRKGLVQQVEDYPWQGTPDPSGL